MRRAVARGRIYPQSYSTDRRIGRLSIKACALLPLLWANADDQGRLSGEPDEIKYAVCPNIDHITKTDIPEILTELKENQLVSVYDTDKSAALQILDWWDIQKPQWAWPSEYPSPNGWKDRLRYKKGAKEVVTFNWDSMSPESSPEQPLMFPLTTSQKENKKEREEERGTRRGRGRGRGNSPDNPPEAPPENSGEQSTASPTLTGLTLKDSLINKFPEAFGHNPNSREQAQLRDMATELSEVGGATAVQVHEAFSEACGQGKFSVSYVKAILYNWVGVAK